MKPKGSDQKVELPNTGYFLPIIYSMTGIPVKTLGQMREVLAQAKDLLPPIPEKRLWVPYLGHALDAGMAALWAEEIYETCKYLDDPVPYTMTEAPLDGRIWLGAADDKIMRERGIEFVDGSAPGFAACVGACATTEQAVKLARQLQEKRLYVFMAGHTHGKTMAEQLAEGGVQMGWDTRLVPFGKEISAAIYALGFASRAALSFGGVQPGDYTRNLRYNKNRIFAFVLALGEIDDEKYATAAGAINYGFPAIAETEIPEVLPTGICTYEHVVSSVPVEEMVERAITVRGLKIKITNIPIPVPYSPAFEGERIRKEDMHCEMGGQRTPAFEFCTLREMDEVKDGRIEVIGPDLADVPEGGRLPLAIWVEVAGRKMQPDFEPILERQFHRFLNEAQGIFHMGQRDIIWVRVSKAAKAAGLKLEHFGTILHAMLHEQYSAIVDRVQVKIYTDEAKVVELREAARKVFKERDDRLAGMTDESVETFYSCALCQSFAPNHICVITPEHSGLCGAYNWLDGRAAFEINPSGPNQPVEKGRVLDEKLGQWEKVNEFVYAKSNRAFQTLQRLQHDQGPDDLLRLLRVHLRDPPEHQRDHDRGPRLRGHDPLRHEVQHPGRHGRRRTANARIHRPFEAVHRFAQVHLRRRRPRARGLDAEEAQGGDERAAAPSRQRRRTGGGLRGQDRGRDQRHDRRGGPCLHHREGPPGAFHGIHVLNERPVMQDRMRCGEGFGAEEKRPEGQIALRLLRQRTVILAGEINRRSSQRLIAELLLLAAEEPKEPIKLFINSPGGDADAGFAIFDVIRFIESPVKALCAGLAASAAVIVLLACPKERRLSLPNARVLIHQPSTGIRGSASDIQIEASEILKTREKINKLIADETGQPVEKVARDTHRNYWMSATEAREYGLVGGVIASSRDL